MQISSQNRMQISYYRMEMVKLRTSLGMAKVAGAATIAF